MRVFQNKLLLFLLLVVALTRGLMFVSYPMGGYDDDQAAQHYLVQELHDGKLLIGNLRYNTGYALAIAPVAGLAQYFGRFGERLVLLVQVILSSLIPFLIYDILRTRRSPREALIVALVAALDPFGLQWAHFFLPVWLVAFCLVLALWLFHHTQDSRRRAALWAGGAGVALGMATIARLNFAPTAALVIMMQLAYRPRSWRARIVGGGIAAGLACAGLVTIYLVAIHHPSTGTWTPSCISGTNLMIGLQEKGLLVTATNGPASAHLLELLTLEPPREPTFLGDTYPLWRLPGPWVTQEEQAEFFAQHRGTPPERLDIVFPAALVYYLGPCPTDQLLREVYMEAVLARPGAWLGGVLRTLGQALIHRTPSSFDDVYLPRAEELSFGPPLGLGFHRAESNFYTGQIVWMPGILLYTVWADAWAIVWWLVPPGLAWALLRGEWFYRTAATALLAFLLTLAVIAVIQPRIYAPVFPLSDVMIGGLLAQGAVWLRGILQRRRTDNR